MSLSTVNQSSKLNDFGFNYLKSFRNVICSWKRIGDLLEDWSHSLECELPEKLSELAQWLCTAEQMIQNPVDIRVDDVQLSLSNINESISHHKVCMFKNLVTRFKDRWIFLLR